MVKFGFGFGFVVGFTMTWFIYLKWINSGEKSDCPLDLYRILNIAVYNGFMAIALYLNIMFSFILDSSGIFGGWNDSLSPIVYCLVFLLFHKGFQLLAAKSGMTDEIYAVCYRSMLIVQTVCILLLQYYDVASILTAFLCGEIFAVSLHHSRKVRPKAFLRWLKMKCSGFSCKRHPKITIILTALITNCLLAALTFWDIKGKLQSNPLHFLLGAAAGMISAIVLLVFFFWYLNRKKQPDQHK